MSTPPGVRPYAASDLPALLTLFRDTVQTVNLGDYTQAQVDAWAASSQDTARCAALLRARHTRVCVDEGGHLLGFADLEPDGHLDHLFVHKDHQRQGIGTLLAEQTVWARGVAFVNFRMEKEGTRG